jgi:thioesterase domain-containing protein
VILHREKPVVELLKRNWRGQRDEDDPLQQRIRKVFASNLMARLEYTSPVYPNKITKFSTDWRIAQQATKEWRKATSVGLEDYIVPGSHIRRSPHDTGMMEEPNVQVVAQKLQECIEKARQDEEQDPILNI